MVNTLELLQIYMHVETKSIQHYHRMFVLIYFRKIRKDEFALQCLHFFLYCKTKTVIWQAGKNKSTINTLFEKKIYSKK